MDRNFLSLILIIGIAAIFLVPFSFWQRQQKRKGAKRLALESSLLLIQVPRDLTEKERDVKKEEKELIAVAENLFAVLYSIQKSHGFFTVGKHLSLEIVADHGEIGFYVETPNNIRDLVEKQIHAQYPTASIEAVDEYNLYDQSDQIAYTQLSLAKHHAFPIKTYKEIETNPLSAITQAMSKLGKDEAGAVQILIRPAPATWRTKSVAMAKRINQNKNVIDAPQGSLAGLLLSLSQGFFNFVSEFSKKKKDEAMAMTQKGMNYLTPLQQEKVKKIEEKANKVGFRTMIRIITVSPDKEIAKMHLAEIVSAFSQYTAQHFNRFKTNSRISPLTFVTNFTYRYFRGAPVMILNTEELASLFHFPVFTLATPGLKWVKAKRAAPPTNLPKEGTLIGVNLFRGISQEIRIKRDDRRRHLYIIGRTGTGKSALMQNMAISDIEEGEGLCVIDPHGELIENILGMVPKERADDVILFDPADVERPMGLNMLEARDPEEKDFMVQEMIAIFYKLFPPEMIGPIFEHNMRNVMLTLMEDTETPGTIAEIPRMFTDTQFQRYKLAKVKDPIVRAFWEKEMAKTTDFHKSETLGYLVSKVGRFVENEMMRNIIGQTRSAFQLKEIMDDGKILLCNLSKGKMGEINSSLLGLILVSKIQMAALSRAHLPEEERRDFYLYIDEFQNFTTDSISTILSEARKYRLDLTIANQYLKQLEEKIRDSVLGNVGSLLSFRIGPEDAELMEKEFAPVFTSYDLINIDRFNAYIKLMIDGTPSRPFNLQTIKPRSDPDRKRAEAIRQLSRLKYGRPRSEVVAEIYERSQLGNLPAAPTMPQSPSSP